MSATLNGMDAEDITPPPPPIEIRGIIRFCGQCLIFLALVFGCLEPVNAQTASCRDIQGGAIGRLNLSFGRDFGSNLGDGRLLYPVRSTSSSMLCGSFNSGQGSNPTCLSVMASQPKVGTFVFDNETYGLYAVPNRTDIGYIVKVRTSFQWVGGYPENHVKIFPLTTDGWPSACDVDKIIGFNYEKISVGIELRFVWRGSVPVLATVPNVAAFNVVTYRTRMYDYYSGNFVYWFGNIGHQGINIHTTQGTCTTPDVMTIPLPMVNTGAFGGVGSPAFGGGGDAAFNLEFRNCAPYMNTIHYKISSTHPADNVNNPQALISLSSSSSASGVKVQLLDGTTNLPIGVDQWLSASQYRDGNQNTNVNFNVPLIARYIKTEPDITPGSVRATVLFHIIYR